jgi:heme-degrading monooxygenase HmoA
LDDPNDLFILFEWDKKENAKKFMESEDLKKAMKRGGDYELELNYLVEKIEDFPA